MPTCIIIAGPNGAGKTTFAHTFLESRGISRFLNVDYLAKGLSPLNPALADVQAAKLFFREIDKAVASRSDFAFETTLSGTSYLKRIHRMRAIGYTVQILFLKLSSEELAIRRVAARVRQGGHNVSERDIRRRFSRGWFNFCNRYRGAVDVWAVYDNSSAKPILVESA